jgi:hypothetical protein
MLLLELVLEPFTHFHQWRHIDLVEGRQDGIGGLGLEKTFRHAGTQARHGHALLGAVADDGISADGGRLRQGRSRRWQDGESVLSEEVIALIDTEGQASAAAPAAATAPAVAATAASAASTNKGDIAMPAAAKMLAENQLSASAVAGTGKDGRVTKGDVLAAVAAKPAPAVKAAPAPARALAAVAAPVPQDLGDRPEQRVPMSRLRARVAERLLQ